MAIASKRARKVRDAPNEYTFEVDTGKFTTLKQRWGIIVLCLQSNMQYIQVVWKGDKRDGEGDKQDREGDKRDGEGDKQDREGDKRDGKGDKPDREGDKPDGEGDEQNGEEEKMDRER